MKDQKIIRLYKLVMNHWISMDMGLEDQGYYQGLPPLIEN